MNKVSSKILIHHFLKTTLCALIRELDNCRIYSISCDCGINYISQTRCALKYKQNYVKNQETKSLQ